jgi:hypothetical protein
VTIGFTPSHCTARNPSSGGIAEPLLILGSMRYTFLFVLMTRLAKSQAQQAGFVAPFSDLSKDFANRREFATRIHKSNELENITIVAYVHVFQRWAWLGPVHVDRSLSHFSIGYLVSCKCLDFGMTSRYY